MFHFRRLMGGEPGTIDNFPLSLGRVSGDVYSPRHRHNFEHLRFKIADTINFAREGKPAAMTAARFGGDRDSP